MSFFKKLFLFPACTLLSLGLVASQDSSNRLLGDYAFKALFHSPIASYITKENQLLIERWNDKPLAIKISKEYTPFCHSTKYTKDNCLGPYHAPHADVACYFYPFSWERSKDTTAKIEVSQINGDNFCISVDDWHISGGCDFFTQITPDGSMLMVLDSKHHTAFHHVGEKLFDDYEFPLPIYICEYEFRVFDLKQKKQIAYFEFNITEPFRFGEAGGAMLHTVSNGLALFSFDNQLYMWNEKKPTTLKKLKRSQLHNSSFHFSEKYPYIYEIGYKKTVRDSEKKIQIWDIESGKQLKTNFTQSNTYTPADESEFFTSWGNNQTDIVWKIDSLRKIDNTICINGSSQKIDGLSIVISQDKKTIVGHLNSLPGAQFIWSAERFFQCSKQDIESCKESTIDWNKGVVQGVYKDTLERLKLYERNMLRLLFSQDTQSVDNLYFNPSPAEQKLINKFHKTLYEKSKKYWIKKEDQLFG